MRKPSIKHEHLRRLIDEFRSPSENVSDETFVKFIEELKHSCLIVAGTINGNKLNVQAVKTDKGDFGMLFTDMDEMRKVFPNFEVEAHENSFGAYIEMINNSNLLGYIINFESEGLILPRELLDLIDDVPSDNFSTEGSYTSSELKHLKDCIDNNSLEEFIKDPKNVGKYEELFEMISKSTLLTLMLSDDNLKCNADDGVISMVGTEPLGFLYIDKIGGEYATVYTSEDRIANVDTKFNKYSQIVNFSHLVNFILNDDMDGIIINPGVENILLSRDVLLEFSSLLEKTCNDSRLNTAIFHMFVLENEVYV